jgi:ribosome biogenesis SPOUT family RNA methylase Rps3
MLERTYSKIRDNTVMFTNLSSTSASVLQEKLQSPSSSSSEGSASATSQEPRSKVQCLSESIEKLTGTGDIPPASRICLLDPRAEKAISPEDADLFDGFLFGGILGDDPPRDRTKELRKLGYEGRHLGSVQMTTDTACYVSLFFAQDLHLYISFCRTSC